jgi:hypothetical protein
MGRWSSRSLRPAAGGVVVGRSPRLGVTCQLRSAPAASPSQLTPDRSVVAMRTNAAGPDPRRALRVRPTCCMASSLPIGYQSRALLDVRMMPASPGLGNMRSRVGGVKTATARAGGRIAAARPCSVRSVDGGQARELIRLSSAGDRPSARRERPGSLTSDPLTALSKRRHCSAGLNDSNAAAAPDRRRRASSGQW